jgi:hypothetical protein
MRRFRIMGLCLMTVVAFSVIAVSAASAALPEWLGTFPTNFTSHGGEAVLEVSVSKIKCTSTSDKGQITNAKEGKVVVTFSGCKFSGTFPCTSGGGAGPEQIITSTLNMGLGYITKSTKDVGVDLKGTGGAIGNLLAEFECNDEGASLLARVKGSVIGLITPIITSTLTFTLNFAESSGKQAIQKLEGEAKDTLEVSLERGAFEEGVETMTDEILTEKDLKIDA